MDELDVKIFRDLTSNKTIAPSSAQVRVSLREIARNLKADDMTVTNRFKKFEMSGLLSSWRLVVNPTLFGYKIKEIMVDVNPEPAKEAMIERLKLLPSVVVIGNNYGKSLGVIFLYNNDQSLAETVEQISRITNAERVILIHLSLPLSETKFLTERDWRIIRSLQKDARKSHILVARELGISSRTVKNRLEKLESEKTLMTFLDLNPGTIEGMIPATLLYSYTNPEVKKSVDQAMLSHFDGNYLWSRLSDTEHGYLVIVAPSSMHLQRFLEWTRQQPGIASAQVTVMVECINLFERFGETPKAEGFVPLASPRTTDTRLE